MNANYSNIKKPLFMKRDKELEDVLQHLFIDASNNYKDNARAWHKRLHELYKMKSDENILSEKQKAYYGEVIAEWDKKMEGYHH